MNDPNLISARAVVPLVLTYLNPRSVIDVGCGQGLWVKAFMERGVEDALGIDGSWVQEDALAIPKECFQVRNLEKKFSIGRTADLAVCLEVAEHLPESSADDFVASLVALAPIVLFSAAIPLQGGSRHVNERWPEYWAQIFATHGYVPVDAIRRQIWDDARVSFFYAQNILFYVKESELSKYPKLADERAHGHNRALALVHPQMYRYYAERWRLIMPFLGKFPPSILHISKRFLSKFRRRNIS